MSFIEIYNTKIQIPDQPEIIEDWGTTDPKNQYWRRLPLPEFLNEVEYDKDGNALLTGEQRRYAVEQVRRCKEGFWFMSNGKPIFITGKNYFYLQFWKLEDDIFPDYRDLDRRYFLYLNHFENISWCLGIVIGKKRRQGATSIATANIVYECIFFKNSFCGLTSKTQVDAKSAFTNMISFGYRQLPVFLKPKQLNNKDSVSELVFAHKTVEIKGGKGSTIDTDTGHRSKVDYRAPSLNAYDSGRISRLLADEGSKWAREVPFSTFISIVSKTLVKGAKRVGFIECPSTTNAMTNGGEEFKIVWDNANQFKYEKTPNRLVKYITPSYDGYLGFIDKYGESVIDEPTEEQYKYLVENFVGAGDLSAEDIKLGARQYLINRRSQLEGVQLEEEIRMNPFDEKEMFQSANTNCLYDQIALNNRLDWLGYNDVIERGNLVWEDGNEFYKEIKDHNGDVVSIELSKLNWVANPNGIYEKVINWTPKEANNVYEKNGAFYPSGNYALRLGCDPFKYDKTKDGRKSNCVVYALQMENPLDPSFYDEAFVMRYAGRANTTDIQYMNTLKMAWYCGCQVLIERNIGLEPKKFFQKMKCAGFLMYLPNEVEFGIYTDGTGNVVQAMCGYTEAYINKNIEKVFFKELLSLESGWLGFRVEDTQKSDDAMASGFALIAAKTKKYLRSNEKQIDIQNLMPYSKAI
jgi:hypothetical protein